MLKKKALEKEKTGNWAEKKEYYNCAVSCLYYSIFLRLKHTFKNNNINVDILGKDSHISVIAAAENYFYENHIYNNNSCQDYAQITKLYILKNHRIAADYKEIDYDRKKYSKFKYTYDLIDEALKNNGI